MAEDAKVPTWLESARTFLSVMRDGILLLLLLMLVLIPARVNKVLIDAGITKASILGFDWEKQLEESSKETEQAKQEVEKLNKELGTHVAQIEEVASRATDPEARKRAGDLARSLRASQTTAQRINTQLGRNLTVQRDLQREFRQRLPTRAP